MADCHSLVARIFEHRGLVGCPSRQDTTQGAVAGYYQGGSAAIKGGALISNLAGEKVSAPTDGSVSNISVSASFEIPDCTSLTRLSWDCYGANSRTGTTQEWIFIDDIYVQIIK